MFTKILVPLDGSGVAEHALAPAVDLARMYGGILILLCTCSTDNTSGALQDQTSDYQWFWSTSQDDPAYLEGKQYLNELIRGIPEQGVEIQNLFVIGDEAGAIIGISEAQDINLIVMTKHCQSDPRHNLLGDITERVLHHASCPVMVICSNLLTGGATGSGENIDQQAHTPNLIQA